MYRDKKKNRKSDMKFISQCISQCVNLLMRKMNDMPSILSLFRNEFDTCNNIRARMLDSSYHMTLRLL